MPNWLCNWRCGLCPLLSDVLYICWWFVSLRRWHFVWTLQVCAMCWILFCLKCMYNNVIFSSSDYLTFQTGWIWTAFDRARCRPAGFQSDVSLCRWLWKHWVCVSAAVLNTHKASDRQLSWMIQKRSRPRPVSTHL